MIDLHSEDFDIEKIADSGQCFRLTPAGDGTYLLNAAGRLLRIAPRPGGASLDCTAAEYDGVWRAYFDMDASYAAYRAAIPPEDGYLTRAAEFGRGIRILRQDPWEMLVTFLISQRKNIPAIRCCVEQLCSRYGEPIGDGARAFPAAARLAELEEDALRVCSLGYRAGYVRAAARMTAEGALSPALMAGLDDAALTESLLTVPGVGPKVASCVSLFGYHRLSGFPRDVWINRVIDREYGGSFPLERYAGFEGVIQQYLFYYGRSAGTGVS